MTDGFVITLNGDTTTAVRCEHPVWRPLITYEGTGRCWECVGCGLRTVRA